MKVKVVGLLILLGITLVQTVRSSPLAPPGSCTNYGCMLLHNMSQVGANYTQGCVIFNGGPTGRKVRNFMGFQGGDPSTLAGTQTIYYSYVYACNECVPPPLNSIAIDGFPANEWGSLGSFGMYECDNL